MKAAPNVTRLRVVRSTEPARDPLPTDLDSLYRRYAAYVAAIGTRLLGRDGEVDDLVQDVFLAAVRGIGSLREPLALKGWLAQVTVRTATKRLKQRNLLRALHMSPEFAHYDKLAAAGATPAQRAAIVKIYGVLDRLPARTRVIWVLRHVLEEPLHAVAELSECSQSTVQRRLAEAEAAVAKELGND